MKRNRRSKGSFKVPQWAKGAFAGSVVAAGTLLSTSKADEIVHDAEYYILQAQNSKKWAAEDNEIDKKLEAIRKKNDGKPPNIVYILWDDQQFGAVGFPAIQKNMGYETPQLNKMAAEGINFTRMYTEPSSTPTRAAFLTGRYAS